MKVKGYNFEGTGGGCYALIARKNNVELLLTDGDMSAPDSFPCEWHLWIDNSYQDGGVCESKEMAVELLVTYKL